MKFSDDKLFDLECELQDLVTGYAGGQSTRAAALAGASWPLAAWLELLRRQPLVSAMTDDLLRAVARHQLDANAVCREVAFRLEEVEADELAEGNSDASSATEEGDIPPQMREQMLTTIALIARDELGIATLETRGRDRLDFHECGVASIRAALIEAYVEGWHASA